MSFTFSELAELAAIVREAGEREIMPRFRDRSGRPVRTKSGPLDLVTEADDAAEAMIAAALARHYPGRLVVGEEAAAADPTLLRGLGSAELAFTIDPVDGTANFVAGLPLFGTMLGVILRGEVVASVIHDPVAGTAAMALRGEGAWTEERDGRRSDLSVAAALPAAQMSGVVSWRFLPEQQRQSVCRNLPRLAAAWDLRCAAHEYRMAAAGHCHFLLFYRLMPWDHAPGWLLHREAGGFSARFDGSAYRPGGDGGGLICAPDAEAWATLRAALLDA